ncbi:sodium/mannose cotransporter SLC5A10 isoform X1 [Hydra vulgaris]|uniref:sodium/mannose cotransporter SLC5A10 isoform X1 n=1 Tax=Hydra vulgaris TaxID=6087 RepID=UPI001F5F2EDF|nr:sodium/glucose cotransporter 5 isoform X1 [Hydra vulgaris]XP_047146332.1 sodium/glucose cotransporter 5 isoform X1 [Hydra vulgaris]
MEAKLAVWDWIVVGLYFGVCLSLGIYSKFAKNKNDTAEEYFLAGRSMLWWAVGGSLYASNMGSEHFIGLAGSGAAAGIGVVAYEWHASWILLLLGFFFVPIYIRSKIYTMPEYLMHRFQSKWMRFYLTIVSLISYVTTKIAVDIYAGGIFLQNAVGINIYLSSAVLLSFTAIYTLFGGLTAVIYTDVMQCIIMVFGALALSIIGFKKVGGLKGLWKEYPLAIGKPLFANMTMTTSAAYITMASNTTTTAIVASNSTIAPFVASCYSIDKNWNHMIRPLDDPEYPWLGLIFSLPVTGIWYWCTDQVIVQRTLGAKNLVNARLGTIIAGFLKLLPLYIMVMPGMIARVLYPNIVGCADPISCKKVCNNPYGCSNEAYPKLVLTILPQGLVGLMLAVMLAALMSSLSSAFNSSSTIFTMDIYRVLKPKSTNKELILVGRLVVVVLVGVGIAWIPIVSQGHGGQLFKYLQTIQSYLAPPTCAVFLVGMLWARLTEAGALTSMVFGLLMGVTRLGMDVAFPQPHCGENDNRPAFVKLHFMFYALIIFFSCIIIMMLTSLFTRPVPLEKLGALTWKTINKPRYYDSPQEIAKVIDMGVEMGESSIHTSSSQSKLTATDDEKREIEEFEHQTTFSKWAVYSSAGSLIFALLFLWVWYR